MQEKNNPGSDVCSFYVFNKTRSVIDTHSHIYGEEFAVDRDEVVTRAFQAGVNHIFLPNINRESIAPMLELSAQYPNQIHPMMGLHPSDVNEDYRSCLTYMESLLANPNHPYVAVGEVGLDFYWDEHFRTEQMKAFELQVEWAVKYHLPLVIHARSAHQELLSVMSQYASSGLSGIFHCFGGTRQEAEQLLSFEGFCLGIGGVCTFKKSSLPDVLLSVPLSRIVLETDSPYLAPVPYRGKRNESSFVVEVLKKVAYIYNVPLEEVERQTDANAKHIFSRVKW